MKELRISLVIPFFLTACHISQAQEPENAIELSSSLDEISGLVHLMDDSFAAINDEKGNLYLLNLQKEEVITQKIDFGKDGDYEGVSFHDNRFYVLKSNGSLSRFDLDGSDLKIYKRPDAWKGKEFEGICSDESNHRLLIARKDKKEKINIYAFDLKKKEFTIKPAISIDKTDELKKFKASGIVLYEDHLILISGPSAQIMEYSLNDQKVTKLINLDQNIHVQIEGIALDQNGQLYVASEKAHKSKAYIYRFKNW